MKAKQKNATKGQVSEKYIHVCILCFIYIYIKYICNIHALYIGHHKQKKRRFELAQIARHANKLENKIFLSNK